MIVENPNKYFKNDSTDTCPICIETMEIGEEKEELASMVANTLITRIVLLNG